MLVLRCTQKLLRAMRMRSAPAAADHEDTTTLGEWYANVFQIERRRQVLFVNAATFLAVVVDPAPPADLLAAFRDRLARLLRRLDVPDDCIEGEVEALTSVCVARTADRSVTATMTQIALDIRYCRDPAEFPSTGRDLDLEAWLAGTLRGPLECDAPVDAVRRRFGLESPRPGRADACLVPEYIRVKRRFGYDWEFVYERLDRELMETLYETVDTLNTPRYGEARARLLRLADDYPELIDVHYYLGTVYLHEGDDDLALQTWEHAVGVGLAALPRSFRPGRDTLRWGLLENRAFLRAYHALALEYRHRGDVGKAAAMFRTLLDLNPDDNQGVRALVIDTSLRLGDVDRALSVCRDFHDDLMPDTLYGRVLALLRAGRRDDARQALALAVSERPLVARELVRPVHTPPDTLRPGVVTSGGSDEAYCYWKTSGDLWTDTPGSISFVADYLDRLPDTGPDNVIPFPGASRAGDEDYNDGIDAKTLSALVEAAMTITDDEAERLRPLNHAFREARSTLGMSIRDVSRELKVPQYRLRDIEGASRRVFDARVFRKYRDFLGLEDVTAAWADENPEAAFRLRIE